MKEDIKARWVARLLDPATKQARHQLTVNISDGTKHHCCLGVLCEIAVEDGIVTVSRTNLGNTPVYTSVTDPNDSSTIALPKAVQEWAGLTATEPSPFPISLLGNDEEAVNSDPISALAEMNDRLCKAFPEIAGAIDKYL